jgi:hypothetical protein
MSDSKKISLIKAILITIIPLGQLWARIFWLDGSLDKSWLMFPLLLIFPFSIIPSLAIYFGHVKKGIGGEPYDNFMWIPIIFKFLLSFIVPKFLELFYDEPSDRIIFLCVFITQLFIGMIPNLIRTYRLCGNKLSFNAYGKAFVDSTIANGVGELLPFILGWMPFIGFFLTIIGMIPVIGEQVENILWGVSFAFSYIFVNMVNANNLGKYCNSDFLGRDHMDKVGFFIMLFLTLVIKVFNEVSPI